MQCRGCNDRSIPLSVWPTILERAYKKSTNIPFCVKKNPMGLYFLLREGPALVVRNELGSISGLFNDNEDDDVDTEKNPLRQRKVAREDFSNSSIKNAVWKKVGKMGFGRFILTIFSCRDCQFYIFAVSRVMPYLCETKEKLYSKTPTRFVEVSLDVLMKVEYIAIYIRIYIYIYLRYVNSISTVAIKSRKKN